MLSSEIIAVGSELLTPTKQDTNSLWLTEKLNEIGIEVKLKTIVGDDAMRLEETIRDAFKRSDVVITTGGLGPTEDDLTRQISAKAIGRELIFKDELVLELEKRFLTFAKKMPEINKRQAYIIEGSEVLPNPNGSAVGMLIQTDGKFLIVLPGPPRELKPMFENFVIGKLRENAGEIFVKRKIMRVSGMGESAIDEAISPIYKSYENVETSILFNKSEVEVSLFAKAKSESKADEILHEVAEKIKEKLGIAVFAEDGETMEEIIGKLLTERGETIALAESCTGGLIGSRLTDVSGSSAYFIESAVTYANESKIKTLNISEELIKEYGSVSQEVAEAMAKNMREKVGSDYAVSVTGIAGPNGGTEEKPIGLIYIGFADKYQVKSRKFNIPGDRFLIRWRTSQAALDYLRRQLLKIED